MTPWKWSIVSGAFLQKGSRRRLPWTELRLPGHRRHGCRCDALKLYEIGDNHGWATILAEMHRFVRDDTTYGPEEIKNTVVSFGCHLDRRPPFAPDGHAVPALGVTDRAFRHGARFGRRDELLGSHSRTISDSFRVQKMIWTRGRYPA